MQERVLEFLLPFLSSYGYATLFLVTFLETSAFLGEADGPQLDVDGDD